MPGHLVALDFLKKGNMYVVPGSILSIKRENLIEYGGYDETIDVSHLMGIAPFGDIGFDEDAILFWRRHEDQLHLELNRRGHTGARELFATISISVGVV